MQKSKLPMHLSPRCMAKTRRGTPCMSPAVHGKKRCRMHGGKSTGAPAGNKRALKHGQFTADSIARRKATALLIRQSRKLLRDMA